MKTQVQGQDIIGRGVYQVTINHERCRACGAAIWLIGDDEPTGDFRQVKPGTAVTYPDPDGEEYTVCLECEHDREKHFAWRRELDNGND